MREPDHDDLYPGFASDINQLIIEGRLFEFREFELLHKDLRRDIKEKKREPIKAQTELSNNLPNSNAHNRSKD